jgi:hypothetical protein
MSPGDWKFLSNSLSFPRLTGADEGFLAKATPYG